MSDKKQKDTNEPQEDYQKSVEEFKNAINGYNKKTDKYDEIFGTSKKEGMLEHYGCLGTVVLVLLVLALLKFLL